jgi:hypothetical protein
MSALRRPGAALLAVLLAILIGVAVRSQAAPATEANPPTSTVRQAADSSDRAAGSAATCVGSRKDPGGPDPWGGCWPGTHNTGVPGSARLTSVSGDRTITRDGAVVDGWNVDGCILVGGLGVTIKNTQARCVSLVSNSRARYCHPSESSAVRELTECTVVPGLSDRPGAGKPRLTIRNSTIDCKGVPGATGTGIGDRNLKVVRVEIRGCENGMDADSFVKVKNSLIHDLYQSAEGDPHTDGIQSGVGISLRFVHNVIYGFGTGCTYPSGAAGCNGTSALILGGQPDLVSVTHVTVSRNILAGGAYTLYCPILATSDFVISENRFSEVYSPKVGEYGAMTNCGRPGITRTGNKRINY